MPTERFTVATNVRVYFCDPRSPWQRGSNENTNGLLRQYLPRGTDFSRISQSYLNAIALRLNQRPRKTWASKRQPIDCKRCCTDRLNAHPNSRRIAVLATNDVQGHFRPYAPQQKPDLFNHLVGALDLLRSP